MKYLIVKNNIINSNYIPLIDNYTNILANNRITYIYKKNVSDIININSTDITSQYNNCILFSDEYILVEIDEMLENINLSDFPDLIDSYEFSYSQLSTLHSLFYTGGNPALRLPIKNKLMFNFDGNTYLYSNTAEDSAYILNIEFRVQGVYSIATDSCLYSCLYGGFVPNGLLKLKYNNTQIILSLNGTNYTYNTFLTANTHICLSYDGINFRLFINGNLVLTVNHYVVAFNTIGNSKIFYKTKGYMYNFEYSTTPKIINFTPNENYSNPLPLDMYYQFIPTFNSNDLVIDTGIWDISGFPLNKGTYNVIGTLYSNFYINI